MRRGVETALRASAAVVLDWSGVRCASYAKRSGRGLLVGLNLRVAFPRIDVYAACVGADIRGRRDRVVDGRRKLGGRSPQLRGALGGMVMWSSGC